jgi:hypothetical protein
MGWKRIVTLQIITLKRNWSSDWNRQFGAGKPEEMIAVHKVWTSTWRWRLTPATTSHQIEPRRGRGDHQIELLPHHRIEILRLGQSQPCMNRVTSLIPPLPFRRAQNWASAPPPSAGPGCILHSDLMLQSLGFAATRLFLLRHPSSVSPEKNESCGGFDGYERGCFAVGLAEATAGERTTSPGTQSPARRFAERPLIWIATINCDPNICKYPLIWIATINHDPNIYT